MKNRANQFMEMLEEIEKLLQNTHIHLLGDPYLGNSMPWDVVMAKLNTLRGYLKSMEVTYTAVNKES